MVQITVQAILDELIANIPFTKAGSSTSGSPPIACAFLPALGRRLSRGLKGPTERRRRGPRKREPHSEEPPPPGGDGRVLSRSGHAAPSSAAGASLRTGDAGARLRNAAVERRGGSGRTPQRAELAGGIGRHHRPSSGSPIRGARSANAHAPPSWPALRIRCPCPRSLGGKTTRSEGRKLSPNRALAITGWQEQPCPARCRRRIGSGAEPIPGTARDHPSRSCSSRLRIASMRRSATIRAVRAERYLRVDAI